MIRYVLWLDCGGGLMVGMLMFLLSAWLQPLYELPHRLYWGVTTANLVYGAYSLFLALSSRRTRRSVAFLAFANAVWGCFCITSAVVVGRDATLFGLGHLLVEGLFVVFLASVEWSHRAALARHDTPGIGE